MDEQLVYFGDAVKALGNGRVGGYLVRFSSAKELDLHGEFFTDASEFDIEDGSTRSVYYQHGFDPRLKNRRIGKAELRRDEFGIWAEAQLEMRDEYEQFIYEMTVQGKMGWSSGAVGHLVEVEYLGKAGWIKYWPIGEASLTPTPAEPRNSAIPLKSLKAVLETDDGQINQESEALQPEALDSAADATIGAENARTNISIVHSDEEVTDMSDTNGAPPADQSAEIKSLREEVGGLTKSINGILEAMQNAPALRDGGYYSDAGGGNDAAAKSFGDFLLSVYRNDTKRLASVYKAVKDLGTTDGSAGGYTVPVEHSTRLLEVAAELSPILNRVQTIPVGASSGKYPALDQYVTPGAGLGETALAAGVKAKSRAEGAAPTETEPQFVELDWRIKEHGGFTEVNNELIRFSPLAIENLLTRLFAIAIGARRVMMILRGNGSTQYQGILNSAAAIGFNSITDNVFTYSDMLGMQAVFKKLNGEPAWLAHPGMIPDIGVFEIGTHGVSVPSVGTAGGLMTMPGTPYPIIYDEQLPQADNAGCVVLADLQSYLVFQNGTLEVAFSEHAAFTNNKGTWRFLDYSDGMPWVKNKITLADPQGSYYVSPFVFFDD